MASFGNMGDANPALIQDGDPTRVPLFLLHDAGGTVSSYRKLKNLDRRVYAIANPWLKNEVRWAGGTRVFVEKYIELIKKITPKGDVLLGGWSLGGQLSIDVARVLASTPRSKLRVTGIVMIDTLFPYWGPPGTAHAEVPVDLVFKNYPLDLKANVIRCMKWSKEDSSEWAARHMKSDPQDLDDVEELEPPPSVLIHASEFVPCEKNATNPQAKALVDTYRDQKNGWHLFLHDGFISVVWEVPAHHFGLFEKDMIQLTSEKVRMACELLAED